jgi:hydrogenase/urease accessory protein HupE
MMRCLSRVLALAWMTLLPPWAIGHEVRPAYLELRQTAEEVWNVLWKVPAQGDMRLALHPRFPAECALASEPVSFQANDAYVERTSVVCRGGLTGRAIAIEGLAATMTDVLVRSMRPDGSVQVARLSPSSPVFVPEASARPFEVALTYGMLGVEHILRGSDHLLFVLALMLLVGDKWLLVKTITAFTVAHSITLAAATLGWMRVSQAPVEAVIALSIVFLASELARRGRAEASLTERHPWLVAFVFGLLHGFGFAGALREVGLPESDVPLALLTFNLGVEAGQLLFVAGVLLVLNAGRRLSAPPWMHALPSYAIGTIATAWLLERMVPLFRVLA